MSQQSLIPDFPHILHGGDYNPDQWLDQPEILSEDMRLMKLAGCNAFSVGIFSWSALEPEEGRFNFGWLDNVMDRLAANGAKVLLATPSGGKPAWLAAAYPEICRMDVHGHREPQQERHNFCWSSPVFREKSRLINRELARRYAAHPALGGWHISNEFGNDALNGSCYCPLCQERFREFLKKRYGSLEELNRAWYTSFWSVAVNDWRQVTPFVTSDAREVDWRRFNTAQCADFIRFEQQPLREFTPELPVTTNFMGFYETYDYSELAETVDFISEDLYPEWYDEKDFSRVAAENSMRCDYFRSLKQQPFLILESSPSATNWQRFGKLRRPGNLKFQELMSLAHGADGAMYFQWRKSRGNREKTHGAVVDHVGHEHTRVFREVAELGELYRKLDRLVGTKYPADVAVIYDWQSRWCLEHTGGPSYREYKKYTETVGQHYRAFWQLSIPVDVISPQADFCRYKLLIAPMLFMTDMELAGRMKQFVAAGGILVLTYLSAYVDRCNAIWPHGLPGCGLMELTGIWNEEIDGLTNFDRQSIRWQGRSHAVADYAEIIHPQSARAEAWYEHEFYRNTPAVTVNEYGKGRCWYIAARTEKEFLNEFYRQLAAECFITPSVPAGSSLHVAVRENDDEEFRFIFNCSSCKTEILTLPEGIFTDIESGAQHKVSLTLAPMESRILHRQKEVISAENHRNMKSHCCKQRI